MAKYTEHLRLVKPEGNEYYNVEQFNQNAELIDKETKKLSEGLAKVQEGATREKAGIVQFGTEEGKALEGMMLARLAGCVGYGGDIQEPGVKDVNYIYYDRNTRKMYKCLNQNSDVSANVANFIPLDNNSLLDRLENLIKVDAGITGDYTTLGSYTYNFPKSYKQVLGVAINIYKTGTATTLENVYLSGFNNTGFTFVKDCVDNVKANTVKIAYTVFYI
ncbi:ribose-phosphate pyrophosphokinase [Fusobacterium vincentii]|uniref:ribose-phosphate pyrophosphokinase n=1 Tax=Fusobacterium vincentii TaxID=155615 RepID=UPI00209BEF8C|nr:ribose-phosphate pyrophosphokinase [Fusobacterium vincentii]